MLMLLSQVLSQQEDVKDELDVTLVYGERDFEDTKTGMFICGFLKEDHQCNKDKVQNVDAFITGFKVTERRKTNGWNQATMTKFAAPQLGNEEWPKQPDF